MYLSTSFIEDEKAWEPLREALERFGRQAGLFDEIAVKPLGKRGQRAVSRCKFGSSDGVSRGRWHNVMDVGYGVSQALPVITELFRDEKTPMFLLQHPEAKSPSESPSRAREPVLASFRLGAGKSL